ncbi:MAG: GFA family protein [Hyphomicrobiaceae bacterium]|nr:GFA family protein [Hyphomicrobiaceae bacterium]
MPKSATACNCTICRRYGALWAYGHSGKDIHVSGETASYCRAEFGAIDFHFCANCGCVTHYVARNPDDDGQHWTAVNLRMTELDLISEVPIRHFDGHDSWKELLKDGRTIKDMWF